MFGRSVNGVRPGTFGRVASNPKNPSYGAIVVFPKATMSLVNNVLEIPYFHYVALFDYHPTEFLPLYDSFDDFILLSHLLPSCQPI